MYVPFASPAPAAAAKWLRNPAGELLCRNSDEEPPPPPPANPKAVCNPIAVLALLLSSLLGLLDSEEKIRAGPRRVWVSRAENSRVAPITESTAVERTELGSEP